jgi:hypothetical protein
MKSVMILYNGLLLALWPLTRSPRAIHAKRTSPRTGLAVEDVHGPLCFLCSVQFDEQVVVVTGLEALGGVGSKELANRLTDKQLIYLRRDRGIENLHPEL